MGYKLDFLEPGGPSLKKVGDIGGRVLSQSAPALEPTGMYGEKLGSAQDSFPRSSECI